MTDIRPRSLVCLESMPKGWMSTPAGQEWFARRSRAFALMAVRLHEIEQAKKPGRALNEAKGL